MLYPVIAVTALAAVGGGIHTVTQSVDQASVETLPGQLIDVGDHRLYLSCTGSGEPTVILEPGLGGTSAAWGWIEPTVAATPGSACMTGPGRGHSDPSPDPQDGDQIASDLHTLLERAGSPARWSWPGTPSAACTCSTTPPGIPSRWPG